MSTDPKNLEVLVAVSNEVEAAAIVGALADQGIRALATGGYTSGFRAEAPGDVKVVVQHADADRARRALAELEQSQRAIDWSQVDTGDSEDGMGES